MSVHTELAQPWTIQGERWRALRPEARRAFLETCRDLSAREFSAKAGMPIPPSAIYTSHVTEKPDGNYVLTTHVLVERILPVRCPGCGAVHVVDVSGGEPGCVWWVRGGDPTATPYSVYETVVIPDGI